TVVLLGVYPARNAAAQRTESLRLGLSVDRNASATTGMGQTSERLNTDTRVRADSSNTNTALVGAGIGAAAGLVAAIVLTNQGSVTDHSEDALGYVALISLGALVGLIVGSIVGHVRK
ncbi:MAG: hypothetical protein ACJ8AJ_14675, partial [Gemmatimonadaceae bacterium]